MPDITSNQLPSQFLQRYPVRRFKKGEIIAFQGEAPRGAYVIQQGTVKAYNLSVNGDEKPVAFYDEGSVFPGPWVFGKMSSSLFYYEAFSKEVVLHVVDKDEYVSFVHSHPDYLFIEFNRYITDELGKSMRLNALQYSRASDKLLYTLHYLALSHGKNFTPGKIEITLSLTHQDFANLTGLTRETAATELNKLKKQKIISYGKNKPYVLDVHKLLSILNDEYITDITHL